MKPDITGISVAILCGGLGKRIRPVVGDRPKPMAEINGRPFLDLILEYVAGCGIRDIVLCTGYKAGFIKDYYRGMKFLKSRLAFSEEQSPLGTAGAIRNAQGKITGDPFFVLNGDSMCAVALADMLDFHYQHEARASMALVASDDRREKGTAELDGRARIVGFREKEARSTGNFFVNAGVYCLNRDIFSLIPENKPYSLEYDVFPGLDRCFGYVTKGTLIDIGTPEGFARARQLLGDIKPVRGQQ
ncbi:MAG: nucleotidyltransferase family protein [Candidatus Omnitrophica bacterium]|nr:nucleotidyltransferase family protein [Candidatus Omnitrophota bacterium]